MIKFYVVTKEYIKEHNWNWPKITDQQFRVLIMEGSGSGKTNSLFNLISLQPDIDKVYLYDRNPYKEKEVLLINKRENTYLKKHLNTQILILNTEGCGWYL